MAHTHWQKRQRKSRVKQTPPMNVQKHVDPTTPKNMSKKVVSGKMKGFYTTWIGLSWIKRLDGFMLFT
jgi:hypothetical protein